MPSHGEICSARRGRCRGSRRHRAHAPDAAGAWPDARPGGGKRWRNQSPTGAAGSNIWMTTEGAARAFVTVDLHARRRGIGDVDEAAQHLHGLGATKATSFIRWTRKANAGRPLEGGRGSGRAAHRGRPAQRRGGDDPNRLPLRADREPRAGPPCTTRSASRRSTSQPQQRTTPSSSTTSCATGPSPRHRPRVERRRPGRRPNRRRLRGPACAAGDRAQHGFTGTVRAHRGRGLATAAKRSALRTVPRPVGVTRVTTSNAEENAAIRAINRKLGFEPIGEHVIHARDL